MISVAHINIQNFSPYLTLIDLLILHDFRMWYTLLRMQLVKLADSLSLKGGEAVERLLAPSAHPLKVKSIKICKFPLLVNVLSVYNDHKDNF